MIHEEICTYEVAKLAKEKGFPQQIDFGGYWYATTYLKKSTVGEFFEKEKVQVEEYGDICNALYLIEAGKAIVAPTQSLLQRWLRAKKFIDIEIYPIFINGVRVYTCCVYAPNLNKPKKFNYFDTYELALEDALKYALENLV